MKPILTKEQLPRRVTILGAARSGVAVAKYLTKFDVEVFISDSCEKSKLDFILASNGLAHLPHEEEKHTEKVLDADVIILSPGIPSDIKILKKAKAKGIPIWSEIEFAFLVSKAPFFAVTGSTGKSTTVSLLGSIAQAWGKQFAVVGNIGIPAISLAPEIDEDGIVIVEVSSFQLENIDRFKPRGSAVLNLMKNHLDRYKSEDDYYNAKKNIARNMNRDDLLVLNANDSRLVSWHRDVKDNINTMLYGSDSGTNNAIWHDNGIMYLRRDGNTDAFLELNNMKIKGCHNYDNACAATALALGAGIDNESIRKGLCSFKGLEHRLEFVRNYNGVSYYNDSKSTTAESIISAVSAFEKNVHIICGGRDKGCDFASAKDAIKKHCKSVITIGEAANRISKEWDGASDISFADSLDKAVLKMNEVSENGDVVVLSPGCSSFDMFKNFEERGNVFKNLVNDLR